MGKIKSAIITAIIALATLALFLFGVISCALPGGVNRYNSILASINLGAELSGDAYSVLLPEGVISAEEYDFTVAEEGEEADDMKQSYTQAPGGSFYVENTLLNSFASDGTADTAEERALAFEELSQKIAADADIVAARLSGRNLTSYSVGVLGGYALRVAVPTNFSYAAYSGNDTGARSEYITTAGTTISHLSLGGELTLRKRFPGPDLEYFFPFSADAVVRDECNAKPDARQIDQKVVACQLDLRDEIQLMLLENLMEEFVGRTVFIEHQNRITQKLGKGQRLTFQFGKSTSCDKYVAEFFDAYRGCGSTEVIIRIVDNNEIYQPVLKKLCAFHGSLIDDFDMCAGKCLVEALQVWNEKIAADRVARSYTDLTACGSSIQELGLALLDQIHGGLNMAHQDFALRSELHLFCTSYKQGLVQFAFQSLYRLADSGLGNKKAFGRLRKVQC